MSLFPDLPPQDALRIKGLEALEAMLGAAGAEHERVSFADDTEIAVTVPSGSDFPPIRFWLAVEAKRNLTQFRKGARAYVAPIETRRFARWFARRELTITVLWNAERQTGFWTAPCSFVSEVEVYLGDGGRPVLIFTDELKLSPEMIGRMIQLGRVHAAETVLSRATDQANMMPETPSAATDEDDGGIDVTDLRAMIAAAQGLQTIGFRSGKKLTDEAARRFRETRSRLVEEIESGVADFDPAELDIHAADLTVFDRLDEMTLGLVPLRHLESQLPTFLLSMLEEAGEVEVPDDAEP
jgi:hypothetical protein